MGRLGRLRLTYALRQVLTECGVAANGMLEAAGIDTQINIYPGMAHSSCGEEAAHTFEFLSDLFLK